VLSGLVEEVLTIQMILSVATEKLEAHKIHVTTPSSKTTKNKGSTHLKARRNLLERG
jgi:hypothetical protein